VGNRCVCSSYLSRDVCEGDKVRLGYLTQRRLDDGGSVRHVYHVLWYSLCNDTRQATAYMGYRARLDHEVSYCCSSRHQHFFPMLMRAGQVINAWPVFLL